MRSPLILLFVMLVSCSAPLKAPIEFTDPRTGVTSLVYPGYINLVYDPRLDPGLHHFIAAEHVKVAAIGPQDGQRTVSPPAGLTLEEAVTRWNENYPRLFTSIEPLYAPRN
jgi:hypothetical protein